MTPVEDDGRKAAEAKRQAELFTAMDGFGDFVSLMMGLRAQLTDNGWTSEQASAMVAYMFGWRPTDGSKPEGVD